MRFLMTVRTGPRRENQDPDDHIMSDVSSPGGSDNGDEDDYGGRDSPELGPDVQDGYRGYQNLGLPTPPPSPPLPSSDSTLNQQQPPRQHHLPPSPSSLNQPTLPRPRHFYFVWVNMASETHGCNSYDSYHLIAALNRLGLGGRSFCSDDISTSGPRPPPLSSHLPSFLRQIHQLFALDKSQRDIWTIQMLYIPSEGSRDVKSLLTVSERTWGGIKGLIARNEEATFEWRIYTCRRDKNKNLEPGQETRDKKRKEVMLVSTEGEDGDGLEMLDGGASDGEKRRKLR